MLAPFPTGMLLSISYLPPKFTLLIILIYSISALKKKYNLNISGSTSVKAQAGEKEDGGVLAPTTPKKIGKKQPRARGKTPVKKSKAKAAADEDDGEVEDNNDSAEDIKPEVEENDDEA